MDSFREQLYPILAILALSFFVGVGGWISKLFGGKKMEKEVACLSDSSFFARAERQSRLLK